MTKTIALFLAHALAVIAVMTTFGVLGLQREDQEAQERFTGVLEENVTLQILDNDTAKETGYLDELLNARWTPTWAPIPTSKSSALRGTDPTSSIRRTTSSCAMRSTSTSSPFPSRRWKPILRSPKRPGMPIGCRWERRSTPSPFPSTCRSPFSTTAKTCSPKTGRRNGTTTRTASPTWWKTGRIFTLFPPGSKPPPTVRSSAI